MRACKLFVPFVLVSMLALLPGDALADHDACGWANPACSQRLDGSLVSSFPQYSGYATVYCNNWTTSAPLWTWYAGYGWHTTNMRCGAQVWVQPYSYGYSRVWASNAGFQVMRQADLRYR